MSTDDDLRIAVIGMACRFPDADTVEAFRRNLCAGVESIRPLDPALRPADPPAGYVHAGTVLADADRFDAGFFDINPREATIMDPQHRLFLECAWEAFEDAGHDPAGNARAGVFAGAGFNTYLIHNLAGQAATMATPGLQALTLYANAPDYLTSRLSYKLDLTGPSVVVQTACSTGLVAVHQSVQALLDLQCDLAVAGAASVRVPLVAGYIHEEGGILSPDGHCRPFDAAAAGTVFSSGVGVLLLKRLTDALADGDHIHALILGTAVNNDGGAKVGYTAPSVTGQRDVIREAMQVAEVSADTIGYVEAHGTGTRLGDPIEVAALTAAFRADTDRRGYCGLGSVKSNLGHLNAAAGIAGLIKAIFAVRDGVIPPTLNVQAPNPAMALGDSPFRLTTTLEDWAAPVRRAGVSAFGIGGTNAHVVIEQPPTTKQPAGRRARTPQLLVLSAQTAEAADQQVARLAEWLADASRPVDLASVAATLQRGRRRFPHRRAMVGTEPAGTGHEMTMKSGRLLRGEAGQPPRLMWLLSGQGAQYPGMGTGLAAMAPAYRDALHRCHRLLDERCGIDLGRLLDPALAAKTLDRTDNAQVALFAVQYATAQQWLGWGVTPDLLLGHSLGELVAACLAGVFRLEDALWLVAERGRLMVATPPGDMLAVGTPAGAVAGYLNGEAWLATDNAPQRCVVAGSPLAVAAVGRRLADAGIDSRRLHTSQAFHTPLMADAAERFAERIGEVDRQPPRVPFLANLTGTWITAGQATDPRYWADQMCRPVRFRECVETALAPAQPAVGIELGPSRSIGPLVGASAHGGLPVAGSMAGHRGSGDDATCLLGALGRLWVAGIEPDWAAVHGGTWPPRIPLPTRNVAFSASTNGLTSAVEALSPTHSAFVPRPRLIARPVAAQRREQTASDVSSLYRMSIREW